MTFAPQFTDRPYGRLLVLMPESEHFSSKPLILLLHGAYEKHKKLLPWAALWQADYDVALLDLPGHGQSDPPANVTLEAYIDELRSALFYVEPGARCLRNKRVRSDRGGPFASGHGGTLPASRSRRRQLFWLLTFVQ